MTIRSALVLAATILAGCGATGAPIAVGSPSPSTPPATTRPPTPPPTATPAPTAAPATPLVSARGSITVSRPLAGARVASPVTVTGDASVFEAALQWRVVDAAGAVLGQGNAMASQGAPGRGTFTIAAAFTAPAADTVGAIEVFDRSPRDGSIDEIVRVPVTLSK
ncbi:MAG: Gmad2 immunoglobulin-like domain-containing protein [Candidatus Limnocylindria bacterium]